MVNFKALQRLNALRRTMMMISKTKFLERSRAEYSHDLEDHLIRVIIHLIDKLKTIHPSLIDIAYLFINSL